MTKHPDIFAALAAPFEEPELKHRKGTGTDGELTYIKGPAVMNRLDNVLGPENWDERTEPIVGTPNYLCTLTVRLPDGTACTKTGIGAPGSLQSKADPGKAAATDALKRAAVKFGVARYLYRDGVPAFVGERCGLPGPAVPLAMVARPNAPTTAAAPSRVERLIGHCIQQGLMGQALAVAKGMFRVDVLNQLDDAQALEVWQVLKAAAVVPPSQIQAPARPAAPPPPIRSENGAPVDFGWPTHAGALYAWAKNLEEAFRTALVRSLDDFGRAKHYPVKFAMWTKEQVEEGARHVARSVARLDGYDGQFDAHLPDVETIKGRILERTAALLRHLGNPEPSLGDIKNAIRAQSEGLSRDDAGGEVVADFDACTSVELLEAVLAAVERDVADSDQF